MWPGREQPAGPQGGLRAAQLQPCAACQLPCMSTQHVPRHPPLHPQGQEPPTPPPKFSEEQRLAPLRALLRSRPEAPPPAEVDALSATQLRDALLALGPLDCEWVKRVNAAEAEYWRRW